MSQPDTSIYSEAAAHIIKSLGEPYEIVRASHVEPLGQCSEKIQKVIKAKYPNADDNAWIVDFSAMGLHVIMGPYESRENALQAEHVYLQEVIRNTDQES